MSLQSFVSEFLTFLEKREERLLSWGFYNVRWLAADIEAGLETEAPEALRMDWQKLEDAGHTVRSLLQDSQQRNLLYLVPGTIDAYRTRFAEGVRLLANLRQMFRESDWRLARAWCPTSKCISAAPVSSARSCRIGGMGPTPKPLLTKPPRVARTLLSGTLSKAWWRHLRLRRIHSRRGG